MLPFVCKCIGLEERNSEHMAKPSMTTIAELVIGPKIPSRSNHVNESFSNIDYLPMKSPSDAATVNDQKSSFKDLTTDCYCNPSETFEATNDEQYLKPTAIQSQNIDIPKAIIQRHSGIINSKRS